MVTRLRLTTALGAVVTAVVLVIQCTALPAAGGPAVELRATDEPLPSTSKPVINLTDPDPFDPCRDIPVQVTDGLGLGFSPPEPESGLRCHYDAGNYQLAVEAIIWRDYEHSLPPDAVEMDVNGHRAAQFWVMKPTDWNNRWWITCMVTFKTSYGVIQQSLFYSPIYSPDGPDCMQENLMRAQQLSPYYKF